VDFFSFFRGLSYRGILKPLCPQKKKKKKKSAWK